MWASECVFGSILPLWHRALTRPHPLGPERESANYSKRSRTSEIAELIHSQRSV